MKKISYYQELGPHELSDKAIALWGPNSLEGDTPDMTQVYEYDVDLDSLEKKGSNQKKLLKAQPKKRKMSTDDDSSAHPHSDKFDVDFAQTVIGEIAEKVRGFLATHHDARPPGLKTITNEDGSLIVQADNPDVGLGVEVHIGLLGSKKSLSDNIQGLPPMPPNQGQQGGQDLTGMGQPDQFAQGSQNFDVGPEQNQGYNSMGAMQGQQQFYPQQQQYQPNQQQYYPPYGIGPQV